MKPPPPSRRLGAPEQAWLLARARQVLAAHLAHRPAPPEDPDLPLACTQHLACFVSLHGTDAQLRGSMGALERHEPLWRQVGQVAVAAAVRDPRFRPLTLAELERTVLEVVCIHPPTPAVPGDFRPGTDGVWVEHGVHRGVLLPGPAKDGDWELADYLGEACRRAGLDAQAWRRPETQLSRFVADAFSEVDRLQ